MPRELLMDELSKARELLTNQKYGEAKELLDGLLQTDKENDELYYLRGVLSLKLKNYGRAQEFLDRALFIKRKPEYHKMKGMGYFEVYELENAVESFTEALELEPNDAVSHFFLAICFMLQDDGRSVEHIRKAREVDAKKTRQLLSNFYSLFIENDRRISDEQKKKISEKIKSLK
jgi:tetratricopeptide (TPR) repeat protein